MPDRFKLPNVFSPGFLARDRGDHWSLTLSEATLAGPWLVSAAADDRWIVRHEAEATPFAICRHQETALMLAAILPGASREPIYEACEGELMAMCGELGFEGIASLARVRPEVVRALHVVHCVLTSPLALALLLLAAPPETLVRAGQLAAQHAERLGREAARFAPRTDRQAG